MLKKDGQNWATLSVKYTFFERAFKREVIISNDWFNDSAMDINDLTMTFFSPLRHFEFKLDNQTTKRKIYPSEDEIIIKKIKFDSIFIHNGEGIFIKFENTCPYPNAITYYGLTTYPYYSLTLHLKQELKPSESMLVVEWISIGSIESARKNVEYYTSVSFYPYQNGERPIILLSNLGALNKLSERNYNDSIEAHLMFERKNISDYTEVVSLDGLNRSEFKRLLKYANEIGYLNLTTNQTVQEEKLSELDKAAKRNGIRIKGVLPKNMYYNLDSIKLLNKYNISFLFSKTVIPPFDIYFGEGLRKPQEAMYRGENTGVYLLPISLPTLSSSTFFYGEDYEKAWKTVIDEVIKNEDLCIFQWDSHRINKDYLSQIIETLEYAKNRGMTFTTPGKIVEYLKLLKNVNASVIMKDDGIDITVMNNNNVSVNGVTFKVKLNEDCSVENGEIVRITKTSDKKIYYISVDLSPHEMKTIKIKFKD